ncbi:hypothetical protein PR048_030204 [Dryococelus australis]|uniref:Uncharacterized protein n=1 Tax=Dryococelus australis TaxID=614101 RepID=A0ABQ9G8B5_9NEOP|nr:hypothetical protein PR048_030204 [Dryococelus australis]
MPFVDGFSRRSPVSLEIHSGAFPSISISLRPLRFSRPGAGTHDIEPTRPNDNHFIKLADSLVVFCAGPKRELRALAKSLGWRGGRETSKTYWSRYSAVEIDVKHVYTEVDFAIGSQFIRHALNDSEPIADLQGNKCASSAGMKERGKREIPEKTRRPTASSGTIPICENPVTRSGIEPSSPWWEASRITAQLSTEQRRNERAGETGDPRKNPPTSGIVRHDSHVLKSGSTCNTAKTLHVSSEPCVYSSNDAFEQLVNIALIGPLLLNFKCENYYR